MRSRKSRNALRRRRLPDPGVPAARSVNTLRLFAEIVERDALRHTPAGVPVVEFRLDHRSDLVEAGVMRSVEFEMQAMAIGEASRWVMGAPLATGLIFTGFLAKRSINSKTLVFHVTGIESPDVESMT